MSSTVVDWKFKPINTLMFWRIYVISRVHVVGLLNAFLLNALLERQSGAFELQVSLR
jgi:hypothetical protein